MTPSIPRHQKPPPLVENPPSPRAGGRPGKREPALRGAGEGETEGGLAVTYNVQHDPQLPPSPRAGGRPGKREPALRGAGRGKPNEPATYVQSARYGRPGKRGASQVTYNVQHDTGGREAEASLPNLRTMSSTIRARVTYRYPRRYSHSIASTPARHVLCTSLYAVRILRGPSLSRPPARSG